MMTHCQKVLYVDDDPDICKLVASTLRNVAHLSIRIARGGAEAIDLAYEFRPDVILMDVMMPGLDGPATLKRLREHRLIADIPVIFLTAKVLPCEVDRLLLLGGAGVIGKPFDPLHLAEEIDALLERRMEAKSVDHDAAMSVACPENSLTGAFLERIKTEVTQLHALVERAREGDADALGEIELLAHSIHGTGAMFGLSRISECGGQIKNLAEEMLHHRDACPCGTAKHAVQRLSECTHQLGREIVESRLLINAKPALA